MIITKYLFNSTRIHVASTQNLSIYPIRRQFGSSDLGKLNETYHKNMIKSMVKSHEALVFQNPQLEESVEETNKRRFDIKAFSDDLYSKLVLEKLHLAEAKPKQQTNNDYSKEMREVDRTMLSIVIELY